MTLNDPLANVLSYLKNYSSRGKQEVITFNSSTIIKKVLEIMKDEGYLGSFEEMEDSKGNYLKLNLIGSINNCGVIKPRFAVKVSDFEKFEKRFLPAKGFGFLIVSTNQGMMTHEKAKELNLGGKLISFCY